MLVSVLTSVAVTCIIVHSEIFRIPREFVHRLSEKLGYLVTCPMCMGFWVGLLFGMMTLFNSAIIVGLLSSLFSWMVYNLTTAFGAVGDYYTVLLQNGDNNE